MATKRIICIYPGRFQPFASHHAQVWRMLCAKFGESNVFIAPTLTSGNEENPFSPDEKMRFITAYAPNSQIIFCKSPYSATEILEKFNPINTIAVFAYGEKDRARIRFTKKDGTNGWFRPYSDNPNITMDRGGYAYVVPTMVGSSGVLHSGLIRNYFKSGFDYPRFCEIMKLNTNSTSWELYRIVKAKFSPSATMDQIVEMVISKGKGKHLMHPWEDETLSYSELLQMAKLSAIGNLSYCIEKFDGQNFMVTWKDGKVYAARSKGEIASPLDLQGIKTKFSGRGPVLDAFEWAMMCITNAFENANKDLLLLFFKTPTTFLNVEILFPPTRNVINYGASPTIIVHSINEYDAMGNEIGRMVDIDPLSHHLNSVQNNIVGPNHVKLAFQPEAYQTFKKELNAIWEQYGMKLNSKLKDLYLSIAPELETVTSIKSREEILRTKVYPEIEMPFLRLGNTIITDIETTRSDHSDVIKILKKINAASDANTQKIQRQFERLRTIDPKFTKFHPIEGIVFDYNGSLYKWTGVFAPINQILGFEKYKR